MGTDSDVAKEPAYVPVLDGQTVIGWKTKAGTEVKVPPRAKESGSEYFVQAYDIEGNLVPMEHPERGVTWEVYHASSDKPMVLKSKENWKEIAERWAPLLGAVPSKRIDSKAEGQRALDFWKQKAFENISQEMDEVIEQEEGRRKNLTEGFNRAVTFKTIIGEGLKQRGREIGSTVDFLQDTTFGGSDRAPDKSALEKEISDYQRIASAPPEERHAEARRWLISESVKTLPAGKVVSKVLGLDRDPERGIFQAYGEVLSTPFTIPLEIATGKDTTGYPSVDLFLGLFADAAALRRGELQGTLKHLRGLFKRFTGTDKLSKLAETLRNLKNPENLVRIFEEHAAGRPAADLSDPAKLAQIMDAAIAEHKATFSHFDWSPYERFLHGRGSFGKPAGVMEQFNRSELEVSNLVDLTKMGQRRQVTDLVTRARDELPKSLDEMGNGPGEMPAAVRMARERAVDAKETRQFELKRASEQEAAL